MGISIHFLPLKSRQQYGAGEKKRVLNEIWWNRQSDKKKLNIWTVYCGKGRTVVPAELIKDITYVKERGTWNRWGENRYICLSIASEEGSSFPFLMIIYSKIPMPKVWEFCSLYKYKRMWNKFITFGNKGNYGDHAGGEKVWGKKL